MKSILPWGSQARVDAHTTQGDLAKEKKIILEKKDYNIIIFKLACFVYPKKKY